jgi:SAM-dependent methyltransferase
MPSGYVTDTTYADTFFRELSPVWLNYVAALHGVAPRPIDGAFNYLELGCGFGTSSVINAGAFPRGSFHACDLNEAHIESGRAYARRLGIENIQLQARAFGDVLKDDLPQFDFIVLHGVYSWVDAPARDEIRQLIARQLLPGGLVYVSYNALPGWSHELPLRKLLVELAETGEGTAADRSESAAAEINRLGDAGLRYFTANPRAKAAVEAYVRGEGRYLAHEFMNQAWEPFYAVDVADELAAIGLHPVGSATLANNHLPLIVDATAAEAIATLPTARQQQLAVDFAVNQRFRRDVFVRPDGSPRDASRIDDAIIGCAGDIEEIALTMPVPRGEIRFAEPFIRDVRALIAGGSYTLAETIARLSEDGQDKAGVARNILFLIAGGRLTPFARRHRIATGTPTRLATGIAERALAEAAESEPGRTVIPSAIYGNGVEINAAEAGALLEWSRQPGVRPMAEVERRLANYSRLGLVA